METRAHHILIGLFTVLTAAAALLFALWMSYAADQRDYQPYRILFERSVSGLSVGSKVQYNGIEVGDVTELSLNPDDPRQVITLIRVYEDTPIKVDTRAKLAFASITGSMSVQLYGGTPESQRLLAQSSADTPFIKADPSPIATLLDEALAGRPAPSCRPTISRIALWGHGETCRACQGTRPGPGYFVSR